ncbi:ShlB/FhaC/HecB family hemolysin secretion/activation protein [Dyella sp. C9]|uniref:ShlB/FhaC/HecB family hemolysin secretion/activation protein n=1 Tax=Dyella sp. C9 TaxID=2202154 RepID=UPI000DF00A2B|nr:ShlB/FhaC/HecB family hemolysin secretion/activation protein [Dyella sp. C9]
MRKRVKVNPSVARATVSAWLLAFCAVGTTMAQNAPTGGQLLQQLQPRAGLPANTPPSVTVQPLPVAPATQSPPLLVQRIEIEGNTVFDTASLHALVADGEGRMLTLEQLRALAHRITDYYHAHGYPLARAIVPPQEVRQQVVRIAVVEARYGQVRLDNHGPVRDGLLQSTLGPVQAGAMVDQNVLDRRLLLIDDLPGGDAHATLSAGTQPGTSDLLVQADPAPPVIGDLKLDDYGDRYTGRVRGDGDLSVVEPLGLGDLLGISATTSGSDMRYGRLAYELALGGGGMRMGASYSALAYRLGGSLSDTQSRGSADQGSLWLSQVLWRSTAWNVSARLGVDDKRLHDDVDSTDVRDDRRILAWNAGVLASERDAWEGSGASTVSLVATHGRVSFDNEDAQAADAASADTQGTYTRWDASLGRLQALSASTSLYLALDGQYSRRNLDSAEQFLLGGPDSVRGYEVNTLAGASGYLATAELRRDLHLSWPGQWQASVLLDQGAVWVNAKSWPGAGGPNHGVLSSGGLGLAWVGPSRWTARLQVATPIGGTPALAGHRPSARGWLQLVKAFQ